MSSPINFSRLDEEAIFYSGESSPSSLDSHTWIPEVSLYFTCVQTREYLAVHHAARHEFLARNAEEWPDLAKQPFFVQADDLQATIEEYLGEDSETSDTSDTSGEEQGLISPGWHDGDYDMVICDESEDEDPETTGKDDEIEEQDVVPNVKYKVRHDIEYDGYEEEEEKGWAEVQEQVDAFLQVLG